MSTSVYQRVRQVLSEVVRTGSSSILYRDMVYRVRGRTLRSSSVPSSPYRAALLDALSDEVFLGRLIIETAMWPPRLRLTEEGIAFFTDYSENPMIPRQMRNRPLKPPGPFRSKAIQAYVSHATIVESIKNTVRARDPNYNDVEGFPWVVLTMLDSEEDLCIENFHLNTRINDLTDEVEQLGAELERLTGFVLPPDEAEGDA